MAANREGRGDTSESADSRKAQVLCLTSFDRVSLMTNNQPETRLFNFDVDVRPQSAREVRTVTVGSAAGM